MSSLSSKLFIDFETRSACDIKTAGADVYARHPSTEILCLGYAFDEEPVQLWTYENPAIELLRIIAHIAARKEVVAHNAAFELAVWNYAFRRRSAVPELNPEQVICTMAMAYAMSLPGALADAAPAAGLEIQKDSAGHRVMMQLSQPRSVEGGNIIWWEKKDVPEKFEKLYAYCKQDIEVERQLFKRLSPLSAAEREIWLLDQRINQRGIRVDLEAVTVAIELVEGERKRLDTEIRQVTGNAVATCTATGQLKDWLNWRGLDVKGVAKSDVADALARTDLPSDCRKALELRQEAAKSSTKKLSSMLSRVCEDGRIRGTLQYHGAGTGRWAGRGLQVQNFPRPKISQEEIEDIFGILGRVR